LDAGWPTGPPRSVNLPNSITLTRIFSIPLLMWILSSSRFASGNGERELLASLVFIAAAMTDGIDGYLARKRGQITTMGILLDPLADKLLIAAAFGLYVMFMIHRAMEPAETPTAKPAKATAAAQPKSAPLVPAEKTE